MVEATALASHFSILAELFENSTVSGVMGEQLEDPRHTHGQTIYCIRGFFRGHLIFAVFAVGVKSAKITRPRFWA